MAKTSISIRLDPELGDQLSTVAARLDRPKSWVVEHALKEFIELQLWQIAAIEEGLRDADAGRVVPREDVIAWVESWGRPDERPDQGRKVSAVALDPRCRALSRGRRLTHLIAKAWRRAWRRSRLLPVTRRSHPRSRDLRPRGRRVGVRWGIPQRLPAPTSPSPLLRNGSPPSPP
jgi:predicted transcriptional regulator